MNTSKNKMDVRKHVKMINTDNNYVYSIPVKTIDDIIEDYNVYLDYLKSGGYPLSYMSSVMDEYEDAMKIIKIRLRKEKLLKIKSKI